MMRLVRLGCVVAILDLAFGSPVFAQTGALTQATLSIYQSGATAPFQTSVIPLPSGALCGAPFTTPPPNPVVNPTLVVWTDPGNPAQVCRADRATFLLALPFGVNYSATMTFTNDWGVTGPASTVSNPFNRVAPPPTPQPPPAPTGVQVR